MVNQQMTTESTSVTEFFYKPINHYWTPLESIEPTQDCISAPHHIDLIWHCLPIMIHLILAIIPTCISLQAQAWEQFQQE